MLARHAKRLIAHPRTDARGPILVVSAFAPELAPLRRSHRRRTRRDADIVLIPVGIGAVDAAVGAARAIARLAPRQVLFVGTAGSYSDTPAIGGVAIARRLLLASTAVARGDGYLPKPMVAEAGADPRLRRALRRAAGASAWLVDVATPLAITRTTGLARRILRETGAAVENLEAFAVARAAAAARIPFGAVLGISNRVGPRAHAEWRQHQERATAAASAVIDAYLKSDLESRPKGRSKPTPSARQATTSGAVILRSPVDRRHMGPATAGRNKPPARGARK